MSIKSRQNPVKLMNSSNLKVSIITVSFNSEKTIEETIQSVNQQTYRNLEHVFIDGVSKDKTIDIIKNSSIRNPVIITEKDNGIYDAMNKGINKSNGDIIFILNSDDVLYDNNVLENVVSEFENNPSVEILYGGIMPSEGKNIEKYIRKWMPKKYFHNGFLKGWHPPHPGFVVKKSVYENNENFNTSFKIAADFELMYRFIEILNIPSLYYPNYVAVLRYGGTSTNLKGILGGMVELKAIFKLHGQNISNFYFIKRYLVKAIQFILPKV